MSTPQNKDDDRDRSVTIRRGGLIKDPEISVPRLKAKDLFDDNKVIP